MDAHATPPSASAPQQQILLFFAVDETHRQQAQPAQRETEAVNAPPIKVPRSRHQRERRHERHGVLHGVTHARPLRAALEQGELAGSLLPKTTGTAFEKCSHMQNKPSQVKNCTSASRSHRAGHFQRARPEFP